MLLTQVIKRSYRYTIQYLVIKELIHEAPSGQETITTETSATSIGHDQELHRQSVTPSNLILGQTASAANMKRISAINVEQFDDNREMNAEERFYVSGLFAVESSPAFKALENIKVNKNISDAK